MIINETIAKIIIASFGFAYIIGLIWFVKHQSDIKRLSDGYLVTREGFKPIFYKSKRALIYYIKGCRKRGIEIKLFVIRDGNLSTSKKQLIEIPKLELTEKELEEIIDNFNKKRTNLYLRNA